MAESQRPVDELTFREALKELEDIVNALDSNTLELEESMVRYERGVQLLTLLNGRLDEANQKIETLMGSFDANIDDEATATTLS